MKIPKTAWIGLAVLTAVTLTYSNHFENGFHFDDYHSITNNVFLRDLRNIPQFFTDTTTASVLPANRGWRPLVTTSLAIDYWLGRGYKPFWFQLSTFVWFLVQLLCMYALFARVLNLARPEPQYVSANRWTAWFAIAWYGLHPAMAETVNYVIQRADLLSTCGVTAGVAMYACWPRSRRFGLYLIPIVAALLCKPPVLIFPILLAAYVYLFETELDRRRLRAAITRTLPAWMLALVFVLLQSAMTPKTFSAGAGSTWHYLITQPYVAFRYFTSFFLPVHLTVDTDLTPLDSIWTLEAAGGFVFLAALLYAIYHTARRRETRPISFGLTWFLVALIPTSVFPLAELENDHRMFFPFVGLVLAVTWTGVLLLPREPLRRTSRFALAAGLASLLLLSAAGTRRRNQVWNSDESLWQDATLKSPRNGRALMNYGLALMSRGDFRTALNYFERAGEYTPYYSSLEINLGIANSGLNRSAEAEQHFLRAIKLDPASADAHFFYGRWLKQIGRIPEAADEMAKAIAGNPAYMDARYLLLSTYSDLGRAADLKALAQDTLRFSPGDPAVERFLNAPAPAPPGSASPETPESLVDLSLRMFQSGDYQGSIDAARRALRLRPNYAEAYNNIMAAYNSLQRWDDAIQAGREAIRLNPDFQLAKNNLAWAESQKRAGRGEQSE